MDEQLSLLQTEKEDLANLLEEESAKQDKVFILKMHLYSYS